MTNKPENLSHSNEVDTRWECLLGGQIQTTTELNTEGALPKPTFSPHFASHHTIKTQLCSLRFWKLCFLSFISHLSPSLSSRTTYYKKNRCLFLLLHDRRLLRHVQTVQELTDILVSDGGRLLDEGSGQGNGFDVVTLQDQFVLLLGRVDHGHTGLHLDAPDVLLAEEVTDLDQAVVLADDAVDGEMGMYGAHLVLESLGDALDHVLNVGTDGADGGDLLLGTEPLLHHQLLLGHLVHVHGQVAEALAELAPGSVHRHDTGMDLGRNSLRDGDRLI